MPSCTGALLARCPGEGVSRTWFFPEKEGPYGRIYRTVCSTVPFLILLAMQTGRALIITAFFLSLFCWSTVFAQETMKQIRERITREKKPAVVYLFTPS